MRRIVSGGSRWLVALAVIGCQEAPGRVSVAFSWGPDGPPREPSASLFVRVAELEPETNNPLTIAAAAPTPWRQGAEIQLTQVPNGDDRVVIVEVRESGAVESELLRYGISQPFSVRPGETAEVTVTAALRRPARTGLTVTATLSATPNVELTLATDSGTRVELSNFETFPSGTQRCSGLGRAVAGCDTATPLATPCEAGMVCAYRVSWDANFGLEDDCGFDPARGFTPRDRCSRRIFARVYDDSGVASRVQAVDVFLDSRPPNIQRASVDYARDPGSPLSAVRAAKLGAAVSVTFVASELIRRPPESLVALGPGGGMFRLELLPTSPDEVVFQYSAVLTDPMLPDGAYVVEALELVDLAGNSARLTGVAPEVQVRVRPPTLSVRQDLVSYVRAPAKNLTPEPRGAFTIPGGPAYFALAPADGLDGAAALPADTFQIDGAPATALRAYANADGRNLLVPLVTPEADGSWARSKLRLPDLDTPKVYVTGLDAAGNETASVRIENVWLVRSSAAPGALAGSDDGRWPRSRPEAITVGTRAEAIDGEGVVRAARLAWRGRGTRGPSNFGGFNAITWDAGRGRATLVGSFDDASRTFAWDGRRFEDVTPLIGNLGGPFGFGDEAVAYDSVRDRVVAIGSSRTTWEWDGQAWTQRASVVASLPEFGAWSLVFDQARGVVVLFGGSTASGTSDQTWLWDGERWSQPKLPVRPPPRAYASMSYDRERGEVILFGGTRSTDNNTGAQVVLGDTWAWDGARWVDRTPAMGPAPRTAASMAYDEGRRVVVLQGGTPNQNIAEGFFRDTWEWDGARWTDVTPTPTGPPLGALFYDADRGQVLSWGGELEDQFPPGQPQMRAWDGVSWKLISSSAAPALPAGMAYDSDRARMVVLGDGTWEWDGALWTQTTTSTPPISNDGDSGAPLAYDALNRRLVFFTVRNASPNYVAQTWTYDGTRWTLQREGGPPPRLSPAVAYDRARQQLILFGGKALPNPLSQPLLGDTWIWDGAQWTETSSTARPPGRAGHSMTYDAGRQRIVRYSGYSKYGLTPDGARFDRDSLEDVWEWDGSRWTEVAPMRRGPRGGVFASLIFDASLGRTLLVRPAEDAWTWDGAAWQDISPTNGELPLIFSPVVYDPATRAGLMAARTGRGHTWSLLPLLPQLQLTATLPPPAEVETFTDLQVRGVCRGHDPVTGDGARLVVWSGLGPSAGWEVVDTNAAPTAARVGGELELARGGDAAGRVARFLGSRDRQVYAQCRANADAPSPASEVSVDYLEVRVRYRTTP